jgi:hypothetical protein
MRLHDYFPKVPSVGDIVLLRDYGGPWFTVTAVKESECSALIFSHEHHDLKLVHWRELLYVQN